MDDEVDFDQASELQVRDDNTHSFLACTKAVAEKGHERPSNGT